MITASLTTAFAATAGSASTAGLGQQEPPKDRGYKDGLMGMIKGDNGQSFSLDKVKGDIKEKACDLVLNNAKSLL